MNLERVAEVMNRVDLIAWDRLTRWTGEDGCDHLGAYGWIRRGDGRDDFVRYDFEQEHFEDEPRVGFTTSSAEHTHTIHAAIYGAENADAHIDCERVELVLPAVRNAVRIVLL